MLSNRRVLKVAPFDPRQCCLSHPRVFGGWPHTVRGADEFFGHYAFGNAVSSLVSACQPVLNIIGRMSNRSPPRSDPGGALVVVSTDNSLYLAPGGYSPWEDKLGASAFGGPAYAVRSRASSRSSRAPARTCA